ARTRRLRAYGQVPSDLAVRSKRNCPYGRDESRRREKAPDRRGLLRSRWFWWGYEALASMRGLAWTLMVLGFAASALGRVSLRTPCSTTASAFAESSSDGRVNCRTNVPWRRSRR